MRVCLMIEGQEGVTWDDWLALGEACERAGLEGLFRSDHYGSVMGIRERGSLDAWTTLAGLAATTSRIRLGAMVSPATFRHPSLLAKSVTTVDHISGGRVELGIGAGWNEPEHRSYGFPFPAVPERMEVLAEQVEVIHRQWTEEAFDFAGKHYTLEDCRAEPKPLQEPHPPLIVGGNARPGTLQPALRFADEYNTPYATRDEIRERARVVAQACEEAGREPLRFSIMSLCLVGTDEADLHERARRAAERMGTDQAPEEFLEQWRERSIAGTVDEVIDVLRELESYGVERALLQQLDHTDLELIELLGREVAAKV